MKIPVFYKCSKCKDIFEVIGGSVKCPNCGEILCDKLEGEEKLKCLLRNKELLIFQKFHENRKLKTAALQILEWFKENITDIPEKKRPMLALYKLSDLVTVKASGTHQWTWKETRKETE